MVIKNEQMGIKRSMNSLNIAWKQKKRKDYPVYKNRKEKSYIDRGSNFWDQI